MGRKPYKNKVGDTLLSVTTILGNVAVDGKLPQLCGWYAKEVREGRNPHEESRRAAHRGTVTHYLVQLHVTGQQPETYEYPPEDIAEAIPYYRSVLKFEREHHVSVVASEERLVSEGHGYGGTLDIVAWVDGKLTMLDLKTSSRIYPDHLAQIASYAVMWDEHHPDLPIEQFRILQLKEGGTYSFPPFKDEVVGQRGFLAFKYAYHMVYEFKVLSAELERALKEERLNETTDTAGRPETGTAAR